MNLLVALEVIVFIVLALSFDQGGEWWQAAAAIAIGAHLIHFFFRKNAS